MKHRDDAGACAGIHAAPATSHVPDPRATPSPLRSCHAAKEVALTIHTIPAAPNEKTWVIGGALAEDAPDLHADDAEHRCATP